MTTIRETTSGYYGSTTFVYAMVGEAGPLVNRTLCRKSSQVRYTGSHLIALPIRQAAATAASLEPGPPDGNAAVLGVGQEAAQLLRPGYDWLAFVGEVAAALADTVAHPFKLRWRDALDIAQRAGADAVPIVMLVGFLIGLILAFQSAIAMRQFGAEIFVASLAALSLLRKLDPLMTPIIFAGRSRSASAAEIGTMWP